MDDEAEPSTGVEFNHEIDRAFAEMVEHSRDLSATNERQASTLLASLKTSVDHDVMTPLGLTILRSFWTCLQYVC